MRKIWSLCIAAVLCGADAWSEPPAILPQMPTVPNLAPSGRKSIHTQSASDAESNGAPRAPTMPFATSTEPQPRNPIHGAGEETIGSDGAAGEDLQPPETGNSGVVLDFRTRELMELKRIARELGGNLVISIEPRGISPADLIVPLKNSGLFEISAKDGKTFLVTSSGEGQKREMEREIAALARRQAALLRNIEVLETMQAEGRVPDSRDGAGQGNKRAVAEQGSSSLSPPEAEDSAYPLPTR